jgi:DNA-binding MarR family transcriptional regulator
MGDNGVTLAGGNEIIHQSMRLRIMSALNTLAPGSALEFTRLKALIRATDGNLGAHLETLEKAGYVSIDKRFVDRRPQTRVKATAAGRRAFAEHVAYLRSLLELTPSRSG